MTLQQDTINSYRIATGSGPNVLKDGRKTILGYNYHLDLKDANNKDVVIFLKAVHEIGAIILDHKITGKRGEVLRRERVLREKEKANKK